MRERKHSKRKNTRTTEHAFSSLCPQHDELAEGHEEKSSEEESAAGSAPGATSAAAGEAGRQEVAGKRPHVHSQRMKEYLAQQDKTVPQKLRQCPYPGCQKVFSSAPGLRYHKRTHSPTAGHFYCDRCKKKFKRYVPWMRERESVCVCVCVCVCELLTRWQDSLITLWRIALHRAVAKKGLPSTWWA